MSILEHLEPKGVFRFFEELCAIPHGSGNVERISDYLKKFAKDRGLFCIQDELKNIIIKKKGSAGYEDKEPLIIQGHMDMVAVKKPDSDIDMKKDGLRPWIWWGDLVPERKSRLAINRNIAVSQGASVEYRGIFINDEDWSIRRWR